MRLILFNLPPPDLSIPSFWNLFICCSLFLPLFLHYFGDSTLFTLARSPDQVLEGDSATCKENVGQEYTYTRPLSNLNINATWMTGSTKTPYYEACKGSSPADNLCLIGWSVTSVASGGRFIAGAPFARSTVNESEEQKHPIYGALTSSVKSAGAAFVYELLPNGQYNFTQQITGKFQFHHNSFFFFKILRI